MTGRTVLSLCDLTGVWSGPYREAGYTVTQVDLEQGQDVRLLEYPGRVHGILAAPPCTVFAASGNRWPRTDDDYRQALAVVDACLRLVAVCRPAWWALENPRGKLRRWLGPPAMVFDPCHYGDPWTKKTLLWGDFTVPIPDSLFVSVQSVEPAEGSRVHLMAGVRPRDSAEVAKRKRSARSATPPGFARAFFEANP
ncbi:MAG: hypothetical protein IT200_06930 [Thermoleophilia bacterium]|nr:hypothetical protein [Thermoleophilia bacterium]